MTIFKKWIVRGLRALGDAEGQLSAAVLGVLIATLDPNIPPYVSLVPAIAAVAAKYLPKAPEQDAST